MDHRQKRPYLGGRPDVDVVIIDVSNSMDLATLMKAIAVLVRVEPWARFVLFSGEAVEVDLSGDGELPSLPAGTNLSKGLEIAAICQSQNTIILSDGMAFDKDQCFAMVAENSGLVSCLWFISDTGREKEGRMFLRELSRQGGGHFRESGDDPGAAVEDLLKAVRGMRARHGASVSQEGAPW